MKMHDTQEPLRERALLIRLERPGHDKWAVKDSLEELRELAVSAGAEVLDLISQKRDTAVAATFIGSGKVEELAAQCQETGANQVLFDNELSSVQAYNLNKTLDVRVRVVVLDLTCHRMFLLKSGSADDWQ